MKVLVFTYLLLVSVLSLAQENPNQLQTDLKVKQLIDKKASYNRLNSGEYDGLSSVRDEKMRRAHSGTGRGRGVQQLKQAP